MGSAYHLPCADGSLNGAGGHLIEASVSAVFVVKCTLCSHVEPVTEMGKCSMRRMLLCFYAALGDDRRLYG